MLSLAAKIFYSKIIHYKAYNRNKQMQFLLFSWTFSRYKKTFFSPILLGKLHRANSVSNIVMKCTELSTCSTLK